MCFYVLPLLQKLLCPSSMKPASMRSCVPFCSRECHHVQTKSLNFLFQDAASIERRNMLNQQTIFEEKKKSNFSVVRKRLFEREEESMSEFQFKIDKYCKHGLNIGYNIMSTLKRLHRIYFSKIAVLNQFKFNSIVFYSNFSMNSAFPP